MRRRKKPTSFSFIYSLLLLGEIYIIVLKIYTPAGLGYYTFTNSE